MKLNESFIAEFQHEAAGTRKMLERVPVKSYSWKPHEKSMTLGRLAMHLAEIPQWAAPTLTKDEMDFAKENYTPMDPVSAAELLKFYDENVSNAVEALKKTTDEEFMKNWTMKNGDVIYFTMPKTQVFRSFIMSHSVHHRAQLSVYLRLLDIPVPGVYGPSADEDNM